MAATDLGRRAVVVGGTRGIGLATAHKLAALGYSLVVTGRAQADCDVAAAAVRAAVPGATAEGAALDLASLDSVRRFAAKLCSDEGPIHLLINNAARMALDNTLVLTADGLEATLATNVIGPFLLTHLLLDRLVRSAPARIINVSSRVHMPGSYMRGGDVAWDWDNLRGEKSFNGVVAYKNSKLATMWFTYELQRRLAGTGVVAIAVCPGFVPETLAEHRTGFSRFLMKHVAVYVSPGAQSPAQAADNTVFAATSPVYEARGGVFVGEKHEIPSSAESHDAAQMQRFWHLACRLAGIDSAGA